MAGCMGLDSGRPVRVWINQPSTLQPNHKLHGKVGIAIPEKGKFVDLHFCDGLVYSMRIAKSSLSKRG